MLMQQSRDRAFFWACETLQAVLPLGSCYVLKRRPRDVTRFPARVSNKLIRV